jgi:hypothetical protein
MQVLTEADLKSLAPSIFASSPSRGVTSRYGFVPTIDVVQALRNEGWAPVRAQQTIVRHAENLNVTRHMIRFRNFQKPYEVGDSLIELVLTNSHDRTSCFQIDLGVFRLKCLNGLVAAMGDLFSIKVRHNKHCVGEIINGAYDLIKELPKVERSIDRFCTIELNDKEQMLICETALEIRYGQNWSYKSPVYPDQLNVSRRAADRGPDLWSTLNRVQENLMKGEIPGRSARSGRKTWTRPVKSVVEDLRINRALWRMADKFADMKGVPAVVATS